MPPMGADGSPRSSAGTEGGVVAPPDAAVARIAARQRGVVTRRQLRAAGLGPKAIAHRLQRGRLHPVHRGVYLVGHTAPPKLALETAALLAAGRHAVLSHRTAAHLWGLLPQPGPRIHLSLVDRRSPRPSPTVIVHRPRTLSAREHSTLEGLPVTTPLRTIADLAGAATTSELERAVHEAEVRRLVTRRDLVDAVDRLSGRRGITTLRTVVSEARGRLITRSEAETRFLSLVDKARLPQPEANVQLGAYEVDALWRDQRLVVEIDGFRYHSTRSAFERDRLRDAELQAAGLRVMRVTWRQVTDEPEAVVARLAGALQAGAAPGSIRM